MRERKNLSLSGHLSFDTLPLTVVDFSKQDLYIYVSEDQECLGVLIGENEFLDVKQKQFIRFQNKLCFSLKNGIQRVILYRIADQLKVDEIKKDTLWEEK